MKEIRPDRKPMIFYYAVTLLVLLLLNFLLIPQIHMAQVKQSTYGEFLQMLDKGEIGESKKSTYGIIPFSSRIKTVRNTVRD